MMSFKLDNGYLDTIEDPEIERKFMLFEDIGKASGDFSYSFQLPLTSNNISLIGIDNVNRYNKRIFSKINCILEKNGSQIYNGFIWIQRVNELIEATFFSGNTNWFEELQGNTIDINMFDLSVSKTKANIVASWTNSEGVIFPLIDTGLLEDRATTPSIGNEYPFLYLEDFQGSVYVHTALKRMFRDYSIKLEGELLNDPVFKTLTLTSNNVNGTQELLNDRSARIGKGNSQSIGTVSTRVSFIDPSTYPNHNEGSYDIVAYEWIADVPMRASAKAYVQLDASKDFFLSFKVNGSFVLGGSGSQISGTNGTAILSNRLQIGAIKNGDFWEFDAGDVLTVFMRVMSGTVNVTDGYVDIVPIAFLNIIPQSLLGQITKKEFVSSIFTMFNVISKYDEYTKTLTLNLFKYLKDKESIELDGELIEEDYDTFISNYGRKTNFNFNEADIKAIKDYNQLNDTTYGGGKIDIDNDYIEDKSDIDLKLTVGFSYPNLPLVTHLVNHNFREFSESGSELNITGVTSSMGGAVATFTTVENILDVEGNLFDIGDWIRIFETDTGEYIGNIKVIDIPTTNTFETDLAYVSALTSGKLIRLEIQENQTEDAFLNITIPNKSVLDFISNYYSSYTLEGSDYSSMAYSFNNFPFNTTDLNKLKYTCFFDNLNIPGYVQVGLLDNFYAEAKRIFNDPAMIRIRSYISEKKFRDISALIPIKYQHKKVFSSFYLNRIKGYKGSEYPCEVELIKLS